ncbi:hypothetical protein F8388_024091 [Cannabis sativa]|uniref:RING-type domain-containing protein n=1 Tax=Cannabis sativa TaxID=3483 RepID=A0A7J6FZP4_CANSA|nr:hypothetical protein G4B88_021433 [Cannabis sativa]KAF4375280.1 hypothetical protein G4B88_021946 [Cannabis sativa]KAF4375432.1 hypothetical protein F8388_024091 [Cannabis sativa]
MAFSIITTFVTIFFILISIVTTVDGRFQGDFDSMNTYWITNKEIASKIIMFELSKYPCEGHTIFANQCSICAYEFENGEEVRITKCGHCFHNKCTRDMIQGKLTKCPICRIPLFTQ